jgi:predicted RNA-binding Zn-ribbon protein involved in translation (DUF1610 family)
MKTQLELQQEIVYFLSLNIVTCGDCGSVVLHDIKMEEITCPNCGYTGEQCDFPDLNN